MKPAYYNEFDKQTAAWLRELISQGHIAPGDVDERSIEDVNPDDLRGYTQCHFFAGIGVWSYALRRAGWPDDRPIWTGSCPCQPFSAAGKGATFDDERHLWPAFHHLIKVGRPATILGEQVASKAVDPWIDLVQDDLEALGYAVGAVAFPSAGVGAPHIRDRTYWVGHAHHQGLEGLRGGHQAARGRVGAAGSAAEASEPVRMAHPYGGAGGQGCADVRGRAAGGDAQSRAGLGGGGVLERVADADGGADGRESEILARADVGRLAPSHGAGLAEHGPAGPTNGQWRDADWLFCRDGKWRPVEPGTFPLAHGAAARVVRLRGYGNAINAEQAKIWIETVMECIDEKN